MSPSLKFPNPSFNQTPTSSDDKRFENDDVAVMIAVDVARAYPNPRGTAGEGERTMPRRAEVDLHLLLKASRIMAARLSGGEIGLAVAVEIGESPARNRREIQIPKQIV